MPKADVNLKVRTRNMVYVNVLPENAMIWLIPGTWMVLFMTGRVNLTHWLNG